MAKDARLDEVVRKHMYLLRMANVFFFQTNKLPGETAVGGRDWGWGGLHAVWLPSGPVSYREVKIHEKLIMKIIVTMLSPKGSGIPLRGGDPWKANFDENNCKQCFHLIKISTMQCFT